MLILPFVLGCLGHLLAHLLPHEKENVIKNHLLETDSSLGWEVAHGRSVALFVALKAAPHEIVGEHQAQLEQVCGILHVKPRNNGYRGTN